MNADRLFGLYGRVADAPDAVERLSRFVLDLAVRGKLVEQDPADESASELLKKIGVEKARLVEGGVIKSQEARSAVDDPPFPVPGGWLWVPVREIASHRGQKVPRRPFTYIDVSAIDKEAGVVAGPKVLRPEDAPSRARKVARRGDVVYSCVRPYLLNVAVIEDDFDPAPIVSTAFEVLNGHGCVNPRYVWIVLRSPFMVEAVENRQRGQAYPAINSGDFATLPFPLPPLAEQRRIVARVDELMALCDGLEQTRAARERSRDRLSRASQARLNESEPDAGRFRSHARFAVDALPALTARADQVKDLRQTILSLAVRGKLVEQDPADEPASESLKRTATVQERSSRSRGRSRAPRTTGCQPSSEPDFGLPNGWAAATLSEVLVHLQTGPFGSSLHKSDYQIGETPVVNPASIQNGTIVPVGKMAVGDRTLERLSNFKLRAGDIVMARRGKMGRCAVVGAREHGWLCGTGSLILRLSDCVSPEYLAMLIGSPEVREYLHGSSVGSTMRNLNQSILMAMKVGLPPLGEQHRIVAKVDELMALCDRLEVGLVAEDGSRSRLLDALLREAVASDASSLTAVGQAEARGAV